MLLKTTKILKNKSVQLSQTIEEQARLIEAIKTQESKLEEKEAYLIDKNKYTGRDCSFIKTNSNFQAVKAANFFNIALLKDNERKLNTDSQKIIEESKIEKNEINKTDKGMLIRE